MADRVIEEIKEILKRTAEREESLAKRQEETEEQLKKTDKQLQKTDEQLRISAKEFRKEMKELGKYVAKVTDSWGMFVESMVSPSIPKIFKRLGINVFALYQRAQRRKNGEEMEIDVLCLGKREDGREIIIVSEVKSIFEVSDVNHFIERLREFREFFDEFRGKDVVGVVAGATFRPEARKYAQRKGFYVLVPCGEIMELWNKPDFEPKVWNGQKVWGAHD